MKTCWLFHREKLHVGFFAGWILPNDSRVKRSTPSDDTVGGGLGKSNFPNCAAGGDMLMLQRGK